MSKQIGLLEDQVHYRLLNRTRTGVSPTQEGKDFYEKCKAMADKFKEAKAMIHNLDGIPRGNLKIASTVAFGKSQLIPALPEFMEENSEVQISLDLTDREIDLRSEGLMRPSALLNNARTLIWSSGASCRVAEYYVQRQNTLNDVECR